VTYRERILEGKGSLFFLKRQGFSPDMSGEMGKRKKEGMLE